MDTHFYYKFFRKTILAFLDLFNGIKIGKYKEDEIVKLVEVPIKFAPKKKFYSWVFDRKHEKRLPMMGAEITSVKYDNNRKSGGNIKIPISSNESSEEYFLYPAPYNIEFELKVATEYMTEMEQIASQILPYFDPAVYATIHIDELNNKWNIPIILDSISLDQDAEIGEEDRREVLWTFSFTAETYISKPKLEAPLIKDVIQKVYTSTEAWENSDTTTQNISGGKYDSATYLTSGTIDEDGQKLFSYEVFE